MRFLPISSPSAEEHGYQINVSKDGSMITAVPIVEPHKRLDRRLKPQQQPSSILLEPRRSPIMFGQSARSSPAEEVSGQGLLDARNKQRTKMKRFVSRPIISSPKKGSTPKLTTTSSSSNSNSDSRSKRFLAFARKNNGDKLAIHPIPQPSPEINPNDVHIASAIAAAATAAPRRKSKVTWDLPTPSTNNRQQPMSGMDDAESVSSFPYLSPTHKFDDDVTSSGIRFSPFLDDDEMEIDQRMSEIQYERDELAKEMYKRDLIRGTIINAIDMNLEKNREKIKLLDEELKQIQQKQQQQFKMTTSRRGEYNDPDPIITADSDSVADQYNKERAAEEEAKADANTMTTKGTVGLDPPARRSPPYSPNENPLQYQYQQLWEEHQALLKQTQKRGGGENGKIVHFDVPSYDSVSTEHRYERHHMDSRGVMFSPMEDGEEEQFNVDEYSSDLGSLVSSDHNVMHDPDIHSVAAVVIQTATRRFLAEIAAEERQYAVQVIQSAICTWWTRMMWDRDSHDAPSQAFYTLYDEREPISYNKIRINNNRNYIDNDDELHQRSNCIMFEEVSYQDFRDFAATEIQRCYRGWWAREVLDVDRYCATEIQRIVRGHLTKMSFIFDTYCIIVAQSVIRRFLSFHTSAVRLASILYIQALFRGYRVRAELRNYVQTGQEVASTIIQAQWRSYDAQMTYINTLADILIVQSIARRWFTMRKFRRVIGMKSTRKNVRHDNRSETKNSGHKPKTLISSLRSSVKYTATTIPTTNMYSNEDNHAAWKQHRLKIMKQNPGDDVSVNDLSSSKLVKSFSSSPPDTHAGWKHHRLNIIKQSPHLNKQSHHPDDVSFDDFVEDIVGGGQVWYDGNKTETSDMLQNWKSKGRRSSETSSTK